MIEIQRVEKPSEPPPKYWVATDFAPRPPSLCPPSQDADCIVISHSPDTYTVHELISLILSEHVASDTERIRSLLSDYGDLLKRVVVESSDCIDLIYVRTESELSQIDRDYEARRIEHQSDVLAYQEAQVEANSRNAESLDLRARWKAYKDFVQSVHRLSRKTTVLQSEIDTIHKRLAKSGLDPLVRSRLEPLLPGLTDDLAETREALSQFTEEEIKHFSEESWHYPV